MCIRDRLWNNEHALQPRASTQKCEGIVCFTQLPTGHTTLKMHQPGIEPGAQAWEACMLPLHYERSRTKHHIACRDRQPQDENSKKYFVPGLNWGPLACEASVITTRPTKLFGCDRGLSPRILLRDPTETKKRCISRESNPGHIDGNDVFYH